MEAWRQELYLAHHGILGMKWGRRQGPPYPLDAQDHTTAEKKAGWRKSLNGGSGEESKPKKRLTKWRTGSINNHGSQKKHDTNISKAESNLQAANAAYKEAKKRYNRETLWGSIPASEATQKKLASADQERKWAKQDLQDEKLRVKLNQKSDAKTARQLKFEEKYRQEGMTSEEAEIAAYKRVQTEKILAATAALTITAAASYVAYKHYDYATDKFIESGTILQNISNNSNKGVSDAFYAAYLKGDKQIYRGSFALYGAGGANGDPVFNTSIKAIDCIKIASEKNSIRVLQDYAKTNPDFATSLVKSIREDGDSILSDEKAGRAIKSISNGEIDDNAWNAINAMLTIHKPSVQEANNKVYEAFKKAGYDAIIDVHDMGDDNYGSKRPVIVFNGELKTVVDSVRQLTLSEMRTDAAIDQGKSMVKEMLKSGLPMAAVGTIVVAGSKTTKTVSDSKIVRDYHKEHPGTELSSKEIIRNERRKKYA